MSQADFNQSMAWLKTLAAKKREPRQPEKIMAFFAGRGLGGFVLENVVAAALVRPFPRAYVVAIYKNSPPYREFITDCNPYLHSEMKADADSDITFLLDWFDTGWAAPVKCPLPEWSERMLHEPDLVLLPSMLSVDAARLAGLAEKPPVLRLSAGCEESLLAALEGHGVDPNEWFACLHVKEPNSGADDRPRRGADPRSYLPLLRHVALRQGGQVVRIGAPGAFPLPEMEGVIDLAAAPFAEQAAAISRARYFIGTDSGPVTLASAFKVPAAVTNALGYAKRVWNRGDVVLAKRIELPDGGVLNSREAFARGLLEAPLPDGARCRDNSTDQLIAVADHMFEVTCGCDGWRPPAPETPPEEARGLTLPLPMRDQPLVVFWE